MASLDVIDIITLLSVLAVLILATLGICLSRLEDNGNQSVIISEWKHKNQPQESHPLDDTILAMEQHNEELRLENTKLERIAKLEEESKRLVAEGEALSKPFREFGTTVEEFAEKIPSFNDNDYVSYINSMGESHQKECLEAVDVILEEMDKELKVMKTSKEWVRNGYGQWYYSSRLDNYESRSS